MKHLITALALVASTAHAGGFISGNDLLQRLADRNNHAKYIFAQGYIIGVVDAYDGTAFCIPDEVNAGQLIDSTHKLLREMPERRHELAASSFVVAALMKAWPCRNGGGT